MPLRRIEKGTGEFDSFADILRRDLGKQPESLRAGVEGSDTVIMGKLEGGALEAFAVFQSFRDPSLHLGGMIDPDYYRKLDELTDTAIYNIGLIHSTRGDEHLAPCAEELIGGFERLLLERHGEYCLLISLLDKANRKAFPLYRSLGFRRRGRKSYYMELDPYDILAKYGKKGKREGSVFLKTFAEMDEKDLAGLADCYGRVFSPRLEVPVRRHLMTVVSMPTFLPELSVLVCDAGRDGEVVGFCFMEEGGGDTVYINAAGLRKDFRGRGVSMKSFSWIMQNCLDHGYRKATLVTASRKLRYVFSKMICARPRDSMSWFIKCGVRDDE